MIAYLFLCGLMVPVNLWAAQVPHLHSDISMRTLHAVSTIVLIPILVSLWRLRRVIYKPLAVFLAVFMVVMVVVNSWITVVGMGVEMGWLDHIFLSVASASVIPFYLFYSEPSGRSKSSSTL